jgi:predicted phage tail protein
VYHSLVEAAIKDGVAPERIIIAWTLRASLWSAITVAGAALMLWQLWGLGIGLMLVALIAELRHEKGVQVRLGYCAVASSDIGAWAIHRGYISLVPVPIEKREGCQASNRRCLEKAENDLMGELRRGMVWGNWALSASLIVLRFAVGVLLIAYAFRTPGWGTIAIGGVCGLFLALQSLPRLILMFGRA